MFKPNFIHSAAMLFALSTSLTGLSASAQTATSLQKKAASSIQLTGVRTAFTPGDQIGELQSGANCASSAPREWSELIQQRVEAELAVVFREEMAKAKQASSSFAALPSDAEVNAFVNDMDVNVCNIGAGAWSGSIKVQVGWQVKSSPSGRMIYQASTNGAFTRDQAQTQLSAAAGLHEALAASVQNLLADKRFASALQATNDQVATATRY